MSSRAYSLQEYCDNLRCIKAKNVPTIAARLARTIMSLPTNFNSRKVKIEDTTVDRTGQYFDTIWDELVGANIAFIQGITLSDAKYVLDRLEDLSRSVVKFGVYYSGRVQTASSEFTQDLDRIDDGGEFYSRISEISSSVGSTSGLTYNELGYSIDQATLNDVSLERNYDLYEFLRDVSRKDIFTWVYTIQNFITCVEVKNTARYNSIKTYAGILLGLVTDVVKIILDLEHKFDDIRPIKPAGTNGDDYYEFLSIETLQPEIFKTIYPSWPVPIGAQPDIKVNAFTNVPSGKYRIAIHSEYPYFLDYLAVNGVQIDFCTLITDQNSAVYLTDTIELTSSSTVSYSVKGLSQGEITVDSDKFIVYLKRKLDYPISAVQKVYSPPSIGDYTVVTVGGVIYKRYMLGYLPNNITDPINLYIHSKYRVSSVQYPDVTLGLFDTDEESLWYNPNYPVNKTVYHGVAYTDPDIPVTVFVDVPIDDKLDVSQIKIEWGSVGEDPDIRVYDADSYFKRKYFGDGWIDITTLINDNVARSDDLISSIVIPISQDSLNEVGVPISGTYKLGILSVPVGGKYALPDGCDFIITGSVKGMNIFNNEDSISFLVDSNGTRPAEYDDTTISNEIAVTFTSEVSIDSGHDWRLSIHLNDLSKSFKQTSILKAIESGMRMYIKVSSASSYRGLEHPAFTTIWPAVENNTSLYYKSGEDVWYKYPENGVPVSQNDLTGASGLIADRGIILTRYRWHDDSEGQDVKVHGLYSSVVVRDGSHRNVANSSEEDFILVEGSNNYVSSRGPVYNNTVYGTWRFNSTFPHPADPDTIIPDSATYPFAQCPFMINDANTYVESDYIPNIKHPQSLRAEHYKYTVFTPREWWYTIAFRNAYPHKVKPYNKLLESTVGDGVCEIVKLPRLSSVIYLVEISFDSATMQMINLKKAKLHPYCKALDIFVSYTTDESVANERADIRFDRFINGTKTDNSLRASIWPAEEDDSVETGNVYTHTAIDVLNSDGSIGVSRNAGVTFTKINPGKWADWTISPSVSSSDAQPEFRVYRLFDFRSAPNTGDPVTGILLGSTNNGLGNKVTWSIYGLEMY